MEISLRSMIVGMNQSKRSRSIVVALAVGGFLATFAGYATGVFSTSGGVLLVPFYAAIVGMIASSWAGYCKSGLLVAWLVAYTPLLGFHTEDAFLGSRGQSVGEQLMHLIQPTALVVLGIEAIIFGTVAFVIGFLLREGFDSVRENPGSTLAGKSD